MSGANRLRTSFMDAFGAGPYAARKPVAGGLNCGKQATVRKAIGSIIFSPRVYRVLQ
jgi:hypothetical protein